MGKTLHAKQLAKQFVKMQGDSPTRHDALITLALHRKQVDQNVVLKMLEKHFKTPGQQRSRIYHVDVAHEVIINKCNIIALTNLNNKFYY